MRTLYAGINLHGHSNYLEIIDGDGRIVSRKKLPNDLQWIREVLSPFRGDFRGIEVELNYNWYWLADKLMEEGYRLIDLRQYATMHCMVEKEPSRWTSNGKGLGNKNNGDKYLY